MLLEKVSLFNSKRDFFLFLLFSSFILFYSLLIEYNNYKIFTRFDTQVIDATVLKQYTKNKNNKTYQVLKLKSENLTFYSTTKKSLTPSIGKKLNLKIWAGDINFYEYLTSFYTYSKIKHIYKAESLKKNLNLSISEQHKDENIASIYKALYTATALPLKLQQVFSNLGVSHLLAISGFHLGVLSALLFFLFKPIYTFFQNKYFPYRNSKFDIFIVVSLFLLSYLLFLDSPPSLLRAFFMLIIGFVLYDRGIKIISMMTLFLTVFLLLVFFPRLVFMLGFWLSVAGVYYIFLFLIHFKHLSKIWQFILLPIWVYILMLPFSLYIFSNFSIYHTLSILWTSLFILFYPLSTFLHLMGQADLLDGALNYFIRLGLDGNIVELGLSYFITHIVLSLLSLYKKGFVYILVIFNIFIFIYAINYIT